VTAAGSPLRREGERDHVRSHPRLEELAQPRLQILYRAFECVRLSYPESESRRTHVTHGSELVRDHTRRKSPLAHRLQCSSHSWWTRWTYWARQRNNAHCRVAIASSSSKERSACWARIASKAMWRC